jgi:hypothetical protein
MKVVDQATGKEIPQEKQEKKERKPKEEEADA